MEEQKNFDLSDIKSVDDLEKTASFIDLMTRSERKKREQNLKEQDELKEIIFKDEEPKIKNIKKDKKRKDELQKISTDSAIKVNKKEKNNTKYGIKNIIILGFFIISILSFFIYSILFLNINNNQIYILTSSATILCTIMFFSISLVCGRKIYILTSILNYLIIISYIAYNILFFIK